MLQSHHRYYITEMMTVSLFASVFKIVILQKKQKQKKNILCGLSAIEHQHNESLIAGSKCPFPQEKAINNPVEEKTKKEKETV